MLIFWKKTNSYPATQHLGAPRHPIQYKNAGSWHSYKHSWYLVILIINQHIQTSWLTRPHKNNAFLGFNNGIMKPTIVPQWGLIKFIIYIPFVLTCAEFVIKLEFFQTPSGGGPTSSTESANFFASKSAKVNDSKAAAPVLMRKSCLMVEIFWRSNWWHIYIK